MWGGGLGEGRAVGIEAGSKRGRGGVGAGSLFEPFLADFCFLLLAAAWRPFSEIKVPKKCPKSVPKGGQPAGSPKAMKINGNQLETNGNPYENQWTSIEINGKHMENTLKNI